MVGRMDVPGRWAGGFRAWDEHGVYLATGRGVAAGRVLRVPADGAARAVERVVPVRRAPDRGALPHRPHPSSRRRGSASRWSPSAPSPPASRTRSTTRPRRRPGRSTRSRAACQTLLVLARPAGRRTTISAAQFAALDALRREIEPPTGDARPAGPGRPRGGARRLARAGTASARAGRSPRRSPPPASTSPGASGPRACSTATALEPALEWVASTFSVATLLSEVKESTRRISELVGAVRSYSQMDRGVAAAAST